MAQLPVLSSTMRVVGSAEPEPVVEDYDATIAAEEEAARTKRVRERVQVCVGRLAGLAADMVSQRVMIEQRWEEDLRQYHGRYDPTTEAALANDRKKSRVFVKITRAKTHSWEARIGDMLFPTDDKNWCVKSTPVPELSGEAQDAVTQRDRLIAQANSQQDTGDTIAAHATAQQADAFAQQASQMRAEVEEAKKRAGLMEKQIEDQLTESRYVARCRQGIHDACKLGSMIMKGPVVGNRMRRRWKQVQGNNGQSLYVIGNEPSPHPEFLRVDPWAFFPDMSARTIEEAEFTFERYLMTESQLRALARQPGFDRDAIAELLQGKPNEGVPTYLTQLREITGISPIMDPRYQVWEYHGTLEHHEWVAILQARGDMERLQEVADNPLEEYRVILWFCQGQLIKFGEHPLETGEGLYSVFCFEEDDSSIFGFGVPYLLRDSQAAVNGAWRMSMDNAGLSVGPQTVVDKTQVEPQNGVWDLEPRKIWTRIKTGMQGQSPAFETFNIANNQGELVNIIKLALEFADEETSMPKVAQGEVGAHNQGTASGTSMLLNSANVVFRRVVKCFDDNMTVRNITRLYDWNMQFNPNDAIKGDMEVDARGSSVLLVRELQAQNLMQIISQWSGHPVLGQLLKVAPAARKTVQALMIAHEDIIKDDDQLKQEADEAAQQEPQPTEWDMRLQIAQLQTQSAENIEGMRRETAMMKLAGESNMSLDKINADLEKVRIANESSERRLAAEVAIDTANRDKDREERRAGMMAMPNDGGGSIGGGGYVSS